MSRAQVAVVAFRGVALWLIATAIATGSGLLLVHVPAESRGAWQGASSSTAFWLTVLPMVAGGLLWAYATRVASWAFRDKPLEGAPTTPDMYRVASAFAGLVLLGETVPRIAFALSAWLFSFRAGASVLGSYGLASEEWGLLFNVQMKAGIVATTVQVLLGAVLLAAPAEVEKMLARFRREKPEADSQTSGDSRDAGHNDE